ncbi:MAG TPA: FtsX-like permease family protein [Rectinemataceae bacterium]
MRSMLASIALRNILRHGKRSFITALVLTVGIGMFIFADSILAGMDRMTIDSMMKYGEAALTLMKPEYREKERSMPVDPGMGITDPRALIESASSIAPDVLGAAPRTPFPSFASNRLDSIPVVAVAVDPEADPSVFGIASSVVKGSWLGDSAKVQAPTAVLGSGLAEDLGVGVGDWFILSARTTQDTLNALEFLVSGIIRVPAQQVSESGVYIPYASARRLLGEDLPVTSVALAFPPAPNLDAEFSRSTNAAKKAAELHPGIAAVSLQERAADYMAMRKMKAKYSSLIILVVLLIAGVGIVNTILMSVYSRVKEIGVLKAYGMRTSSIRRLFSLEGLFLGLAGSLGGLVFGALCIWASIAWGIRFDKLLGGLDMGSIPLGGVLRGEWNPRVMIQGLAFGTLASWLSAAIPAARAGRLEATEALRFS